MHDPNRMDLDLIQITSSAGLLLSQLWCQLGLLVLFSLFLWDACILAKNFTSFGLIQFSQIEVAVRTDSSQDIKQIIASNINATFKLLLAGCVESEGNFTFVSNRHILFNTSRFIQFDGFAISIFSRNGSFSGLYAWLRGSNDGARWTTVWRSADFRKVSTGIRFLENSTVVAGGAEGNVSFDFRAPWPLITESCIHSCIVAAGCLSAAMLGIFRRTEVAKRFLLLAGMLCSMNAALSGLGQLLLITPRDSFLPLLHAAIYLAGTVAFWQADKAFFAILAVLALVSLLGRYIQDCRIYPDCSHLSEDPPVEAICCAAIGAGVLLLHRSILFRSLRLVARDRAGHDARWRELMENPAEREALQRLHLVAKELPRGRPRALARQLNRQHRGDQAQRENWLASLLRQANAPGKVLYVAGMVIDRIRRGGSAASARGGGPEAVESEDGTIAGVPDEGRPVESLDQLYAQAAAAAHFMLPACARWAAQANGELDHPPLHGYGGGGGGGGGGGDGGVGAEGTALVSNLVAGWVRARYIKDPARAIEKLVVCYCGDASRLLDLCRARICFGSVADALRCADAVMASAPFVRVAGIKNGLRPNFDAGRTAGYRVRPDPHLLERISCEARGLRGAVFCETLERTRKVADIYIIRKSICVGVS